VPAATKKKATARKTVTVRTPNKPGHSSEVNAEKYEAMRKILKRVMPRKSPGYTQPEMMTAVGKVAPKGLFPKHTYHWWAKCVELDMEVRSQLAREKTTPLRWHLTS
jgi:hypothetical protein